MNYYQPTIISRLLVSRIHNLIKKFSTQLYIGWVLFIALITLLPGYSVPDIVDWNFLELDKFIHMVVFAVLTFLGSFAFAREARKSTGAIALSLIIAITYGGVIELLQTFIPQRGFDFADLTADAIGAILGVAFFHKFFAKSIETPDPQK